MFENGKYIIKSSKNPQKEDIIEITNTNCEFDFDSYLGRFSNDNLKSFEVELEIIDQDLSNYIDNKSNNGGAYAFALARIKNIA